ncbi:hypothetical protein CEY12_07580 [Chryseobacterium sp. T16E-39]|uniref:hypothetical protein n=1 Tax=Chryseobacterium sp. T16E-39 TaxID=2015076 RepID=UPI000B5B1541|nr:hypothetical protein [Chryseobacterium sp. T16E-39]ASK29976.1 hypothetical protein CEY12_07580 [Chryseobacterium sp. T16E-39]
MKKIIAIAFLTLGIFSITSCTAKQAAQSMETGNNSTLEASGKITKIENGKDGYMATFKDASGKEYVATISIINLQKGSSQFKRYEVGDMISVKGSSWDNDGVTHITASELSGTASDSTTLSVTGKVTNIENGKDGYMATIQDADGKEYTATISIVNLQKSGGTFKRYEIGNTISVKGPSWKDDQGKTYIKAEQLK